MGNQGYIYSNSFVHKLNPALKFIGFILMIVLIFLPLGYFGQLIVGSMVLVGFLLSKLSGKTLFNILKSVLILFALLLLINWAIYKEPIAVYLNNSDSNVIGSVTGSLTVNGMPNNVYVSELWGGSSPTILAPTESNINQIIEANFKNNTTQQINTALENVWKSFRYKDEFKLMFGNNVDLAKKYCWIISQPTLIIGDKTVHLQQISNYPLFNATYDASGKLTSASVVNSFVYFEQYWYTFSPKAINLALYVSIKVFLMIVLATLLTATTSAIELTNGLQAIFSPLRIFRLPVNEMSMMIAIALRFVPSLLIESKRILNAQASRGVDFHNGGMLTKLKALTSLVVPLFSIAFKNADDLANAMEARGYNPRKARTKYRLLSIRWYDWVAFSFLGLVLGLFIGLMTTHFVFGPFGILELGILLG